MGCAIWYGTGDIDGWLNAGGWERVGHLALLIAVGGGVYFATLFVSGIRLRHFKR
jgi:putative peptidoglycan lipid II flippase